MVEIARGIHAFIEKMDHPVVSGNSIVIEGDTGLVVVDTGHHPRLTRQMIDRIRAMTAKPVQYVVNTHWHNDHVSGNWLYAEAFPDAKFVAQSFTAKMIDQEVKPYMATGCAKFLADESAPLRASVASGLGPGGKKMSEGRAAALRRTLDDADAAAAECGEFRFRGTDIAFDDRITLRLGHRDVQVLFLGRANTAGDAVVYVPDAKVVMTGDILVHPFPFATQSYIGEWGAVLRRIEAMDVDTIVPGHGPVMRDKKYLVEIASLMESIDAQVRAAYRPDMGLEELRKHVDLTAFRKEIAGESDFIGANFDVAAQSAVERAWQQVRGHLEPEGLPKG